MADLSVSLLTVLSQILWESLGSEWLAGDLSCRLVKVAQVFGLAASSNMVVIIALERQQVIANPLAIPLSVTKMCAASWVCAVLFSLPQAFVFRETKLNSSTQCLGIFDNLPKWHFQMYIIYGAMVVFFVPFCILCFAYARILCIIWNKEKRPKREKVGSDSTTANTQFHLNPANSSLPKAKVKTLKMTLMIILLFIICGLPYFVVEMKFAFGNVTELDEDITAVLGIFVVSNSAANPIIYLYFNSKKSVKADEQKDGGNKRATSFSLMQKNPG
ncbi:probable G-protein coupled receptor 150 [Polyodon spathula]|nr:probable G-protein coupled receptor 150 [Polyodon spathula]